MIALVSLTVGVIDAGVKPGSSFVEVRNWLQMWRSGAHLYTLTPPVVDYPPNAIVMLYPISYFTGTVGETWFAIFNVAICAVASWSLVAVASRLAGVHFTRPERLAYTLMLLALAPVRVSLWNGQTTPLILMWCCLSIHLWHRWPVISGMALGLGIAKPHVALAFLLVTAFARQWRVLATGLGTAIAMAIVYCQTVALSPWTVLRQYLATLCGVYAGPRFNRGEVDLRPFFIDLFQSYGLGEPLYLVAAGLIAWTLLWLTWRARHKPEALALVMSAACMTSLAVFPFRRYGLLLLAPTLFTFLWQQGLSRSQSLILSAVIAIETADVPFLIRHWLLSSYQPGSAPTQWPNYINRAAIVVFLVMSLTALERAGRSSALANVEPEGC